MARKTLKFLTSNRHKFLEVKKLLAPIVVEQLNVELDEIQDLDLKRIIRHKLRQAFLHHRGPFIIEDGSLEIAAFGRGLPGPFIKFFNERLGQKRMSSLAVAMRQQAATAKVVFAYAADAEHIRYFTGELRGKIVKPKGHYGFGYDPIFQPEGCRRTLGQIKGAEDFSQSARGLAARKLKTHLLRNYL
ncbi:MAG: non-canonical purine NTP pyrophosphatase [Patescibacteria group bacterium]|nr:non-canonical purine NTP pyrophosphatase [Patescibacteria group bacterium]